MYNRVMESVRSQLVTEEEFLSLPESLERQELLDGEVIVAPSPSFRHQEVLRRILAALGLWADRQERPVTIGQSPLDVRFAPGRILQPDAFVILDAVPLDLEGPVQRVPEICIEVLSTDRVYDRVTKRYVYAAAGVREYWVVHARGPIERMHGEGLGAIELCSERLVTPLLPGLELDVSTLFASHS
jgi:Uma2 family endonuclease